MKKLLKIVIAFLRMMGGRQIARAINRGIRKLSAATHFLQYSIEWGTKPVPGWFDHHIGLHYSWKKTQCPMAWERGIFNLLAMKQGAEILELCCGGGFNSYYFYATRAHNIIAMDIDGDAIREAQKNHSAGNIKFLAADIRHDIPQRKFDNIILDASLEYFTEQEIEKLMLDIKARMATNGIVSGHSIAQQVLHEEWKCIFKCKEDLAQFLVPYFKNIRVFETIYPNRHNLYFYAGDGELPFDEKWPMQVTLKKSPPPMAH